ncbi:arginine--tRNA ligase, partial [Candidatus Uhrbacteria bacterium]|nr:arginine--tRNA ligase [Candidatus Uhrbacteria bacterium]
MYTFQKINQSVLAALKAALGKRMTPTVEMLTSPPDERWGDLSFPCFEAAKGLRQAPAELAAELAPKVEPKGMIAKVEAQGPYVNFFIEAKAVAPGVCKEIETLEDRYGGWNVGRRKRVMVEYAQLNTHKAAHVGHVRNMVLGQAIANLLANLGYRVVSAGFHGDVGAHVATTLWGLLKFHSGETPPKTGRGLWLNTVYSQAVKYLEDHPKAKEEVAECNRKLEAGDRTLAKLWKQTRAWSIQELNQVFQDLGVRLERRYYESEMDEPGRRMVAELVSRGLAKKSQGAIVMPLESFG